MAFFNPSNQLLQIDTGNALTYLYNSAKAISIYAGIGENQVLGQRYVGVNSATTSNPSGSPAIYMLVNYLSTSAITTGNLTTAAAPAPVWWTDTTFTTVTGISTEAVGGTTLGLNFPAGFLMINTTSVSGLTAAQLVGAQVLIQVGGYLPGAYMSASSNAGIGATIIPAAGTFTSAFVAAGSQSSTYKPFGRQLSALSSGLCNVLVDCDNF